MAELITKHFAGNTVTDDQGYSSIQRSELTNILYFVISQTARSISDSEIRQILERVIEQLN